MVPNISFTKKHVLFFSSFASCGSQWNYDHWKRLNEALGKFMVIQEAVAIGVA